MQRYSHLLAPAIVVFFALVFVVGIVGTIFNRLAKEEARLKQIAAEVQRAKVEMQEIIVTNKDKELSEFPFADDPWGNPYAYSTSETPEKVFKTYRVYSFGPDKTSGTKDDIVVTDDDFVWTKAGEAAGVRVGRATRGFLSGFWKSDDKK